MVSVKDRHQKAERREKWVGKRGLGRLRSEWMRPFFFQTGEKNGVEIKLIFGVGGCYEIRG